MAAHVNEIAFNVLSRVDGIHVLDVYWLTLRGQTINKWVLLLSILCMCSAEGDAKGLQTHCGD
jgi:hypothetical protein